MSDSNELKVGEVFFSEAFYDDLYKSIWNAPELNSLQSKLSMHHLRHIVRCATDTFQKHRASLLPEDFALVESSELKNIVDENLSLRSDYKQSLLELEAAQKEIELLELSQFPDELTEPLREVLGLMCFQIGHFAHIYEKAGYPIKKKAEDEQAFILHRYAHFALRHGSDWRTFAQEDLVATNEKAKEMLEASPKPEEG